MNLSQPLLLTEFSLQLPSAVKNYSKRSQNIFCIMFYYQLSSILESLEGKPGETLDSLRCADACKN